MSNTPKKETRLIINGKECRVTAGSTVIQACEQEKVWVPRFCYHEKLSISGNCRMCLVEQEKAPKPLIAACALTVSEGLRILTDTPLVRKAREAVLEFLFINHPLDCPICDQGGECDLQDQAAAYGSDRGRYRESKRAMMNGFGFQTTGKSGETVKEDFGPFINTSMTRCIHCTRCIRYSREITGTPESIGISGRGRHSEVEMYGNIAQGQGNTHNSKMEGGALGSLMSSELSGNLVDICPVGALTSKPYGFTGRSWELKGTESIDVMDGLGSNIRVEGRGAEVMRILPRSNEEINEEWLSDRGRFSLDGLKRQRLITPLYREKNDRDYREISWKESLEIFKNNLQESQEKGENVTCILGDLVDLETTVLVKELWSLLGSDQIYLESTSNQQTANVDFPTNYKFNQSLDLNSYDCCLLMNLNPKKEGAVWNSKLRQRFLGSKASLGVEKKFQVAHIGSALNTITASFPMTHLGSSMKSLVDLVEGRSRWLKVLLSSKAPLIIIGSESFQKREDGLAMKGYLDKLQSQLKGGGISSLFALSASLVGSYDVGVSLKSYKRDSQGKGGFYYVVGSDTKRCGEDLLRSISEKPFIVYQGTHGDRGAALANLILPSLTYTEKTASYVNVQGRIQVTQKASFGMGSGAKEDWRIVRALKEYLNLKGSNEQVVVSEAIKGASLSTNTYVNATLDNLAPHLKYEMGNSVERVQESLNYTVTPSWNYPRKNRLALTSLQPREEEENVISRNSLVISRYNKRMYDLTKERSWGG